jgi:hypothetical protein
MRQAAFFRLRGRDEGTIRMVKQTMLDGRVAPFAADAAHATPAWRRRDDSRRMTTDIFGRGLA